MRPSWTPDKATVKEWELACEYAKTKKTSILNKLIAGRIKYVEFVAERINMKFHNVSHPTDLYSYGMQGLWRYFERFDPASDSLQWFRLHVQSAIISYMMAEIDRAIKKQRRLPTNSLDAPAYWDGDGTATLHDIMPSGIPNPEQILIAKEEGRELGRYLDDAFDELTATQWEVIKSTMDPNYKTGRNPKGRRDKANKHLGLKKIKEVLEPVLDKIEITDLGNVDLDELHASKKICTDCSEVKPLDEFNRNKPSADGHINQCKICAQEKRRCKRAGIKYVPRKPYAKPPATHKQCGVCKQVKRVEEFRSLGTNKDGSDMIAWWCYECFKAYQRQRRAEGYKVPSRLK